MPTEDTDYSFGIAGEPWNLKPDDVVCFKPIGNVRGDHGVVPVLDTELITERVKRLFRLKEAFLLE